MSVGAKHSLKKVCRDWKKLRKMLGRVVPLLVQRQGIGIPRHGRGGSTYDYGFRLYNPEIGKFLIVDSISANFQNLSPYQFVGLDSIKFIDLDGLERAIHRSGRGHVIPASDFHQHTPECQSNLACIGTFITQKHSGKQESACSGITTHEEYDTLPAGRQEIEATTI